MNNCKYIEWDEFQEKFWDSVDGFEGMLEEKFSIDLGSKYLDSDLYSKLQDRLVGTYLTFEKDE